MGGAVNSGEQQQTADAATQSALETEIAAGQREPLLQILDVRIASYTCSEHPGDFSSEDYDCSYTAEFTVSYETKDWARIQCFFSNAESDAVNAEPGADTISVSATYETLVFAPGTTFNGFCQMRDQETDEVMAQSGGAAGGWEIELTAP